MAIVWKWGLNGNANALVWSNWTATNVTWVDWKSNWAWSFNGTSSWINLWTPYSWFSTWYISLICKTNTISYANWESWVFCWRATLIETTWEFDIVFNNTNGFRFLWKNPSNYLIIQQWAWHWIQNWVYYHILATWDSNWKRFYINGKLIWTNSDTTPVFTTWGSTFLNIGRVFSSSPQYYFNWLIDECEVWNTSLTPAEVKNKYLFLNWFI